VPSCRHRHSHFTISAAHSATRERVWRAWTLGDGLQRWFGPTGCTVPLAGLELRPGGSIHSCRRTPRTVGDPWSL